MKVSEVARTFGLSSAQSAKLRIVARDATKAQTADSLHKSALAAPTALASLKAQLVDLIEGRETAQPTASAAPTPPAAPKVAPPPPPAAKVIAWVLVDGSPVAYVSGMSIANGQLICYAGDENASEPWKPFGATTSSQPARQVETRVNTLDDSIPSIPGTTFKLPYILGGNVGSDGTIYAQFGYRRGREFNRCSVKLSELLQVLDSPQHVADIVRTLREFQTRLGG